MRTAFMLVLCLLLGFLLQAALATYFALRSPIATSGFDTGLLVSLYRHPGMDWTGPRTSGEAAGVETAKRLFPQLKQGPTVYQQFSVQYWQARGVVIASSFADLEHGREKAQVYESGWPLLSMSAKVDEAGLHNGWRPPVGWTANDRHKLYVHFSLPAIEPVVPLRPRLVGTVVNTLVFGGPLALLVLGVAYVRARRRHHVDCCQVCGYERTGLPADAPCPECGKGTPSASSGDE